MFNNFFFFVNRAVYKMCKNNEQSYRPIDYNKAQDNYGYKHSEYVIVIAIPRQQCAKAHQCYGIHTLPVLCVVTSVQHRIPEIMVTQEEDDYKKTTLFS
jgi:hypothetical protein